MPVKKRSMNTEDAPTKRRQRAARPTVEVELPVERSTPKEDIGDYSMLLFGEEKIGKTTLAAQFPAAFFLMCEPGGKALSIFQKPVNSWPEFLAYLDLLESGKHKFKTVVIDTVDILFGFCMDYICSKLVIDHPSDEAYGKGWKALRDEFTKAMVRVHQMDIGCLFLSHATEKEITRRNGETSHRIIPTMPKQAREVLEGLVDILAYYHYNADSKRELQIAGDDLVSAGHRLEHAFQKTDIIPMGDSAKEGFQNFVAAFGNEEVKRQSGGTASAASLKRVVRRKK